MTDTPDTAEPDVDSLSFEAALKALEQVVEKLESGDTPLEDAIALYERGARLKAHCEAKLAAAEMKVAQITQGPDGTPTAKPAAFD